MKFAIVFDDNPDAAPDLRKQHMQAHLSFLERHGDIAEAAGPLSDDQGKVFGGLWIVEAATAAAADRLVREDPFWPTGLRQSYRVLVWNQVFAGSRRLINPA